MEQKMNEPKQEKDGWNEVKPVIVDGRFLVFLRKVKIGTGLYMYDCKIHNKTTKEFLYRGEIFANNLNQLRGELSRHLQNVEKKVYHLLKVKGKVGDISLLFDF
jgi:hypothetical protein